VTDEVASAAALGLGVPRRGAGRKPVRIGRREWSGPNDVSEWVGGVDGTRNLFDAFL